MIIYYNIISLYCTTASIVCSNNPLYYCNNTGMFAVVR